MAEAKRCPECGMKLTHEWAHVESCISRQRDNLAQAYWIVWEKLKAAEAVISAQSDLIMWYEDDHERDCYEDSNVPPELLELEQAIDAARTGATP